MSKDDDLLVLNKEKLRQEVRRLRHGIRAHRDQRGDDRCWIDDEKLYGLLPDGVHAETLLDPELMLRNCKRFVETRQHPCDRFAWGSTPGGSMLPTLEQAERELPALLLHVPEWESLLIADEKPNVERVWMPYGDGRLCLHVIHPCYASEPLYHPHPWPSAMRICRGWYETAYGHGPSDGPAPPKGNAKVIGNGEKYEMVDPTAWHYVRPLGEKVLSVMVTGRPWNAPGNRKGRSLAPLPLYRKVEIIDAFKELYPRTA